jgi:hypothetical protein
MSEAWHPAPFQRRGMRFITEHACAGLFWDPGMRKTSTMLGAFKVLKNQGYVRRMLVISPLRPAQRTWPAEVRKWREFSEFNVKVLHEGDRTWHNAVTADVSVINPEGLPWLFASSLRGPWPWDVLCVDESTQFKHTRTKRFKLLKPHLEKFRRRYILTGSPAPNGLIDLFGQVFILDLGHTLGRFITKYRTDYFISDAWGFKWTPKEGTHEQIYQKLAPLVSRLDARDYLDLPPLIRNRVEVELPPAVMKIYRQMEAFLIAEVESGKVVAKNAAAASSKCRQIANGGVYGTDAAIRGGSLGDSDVGSARTVHHLHEAKVDAVAEIVEELQGTPALVAYEFDHDLERLQRRFPDAPYVGGGVGTKRFGEIEEAWNRGDLPVLLAQPKSVKWGLNLQGTRGAIIKAGLSWDLDEDDQFVKRVWRDGQKFPVTEHSIVAKDTVDEVIMATVARKDRTQRGLLDALREYGRSRR